MNILERIINEFKIYARRKVEEHTSTIRQQYAGATINNEKRLKIFDEHLDELKNELQEKMREIIGEHKTNLNDTAAIPVELFSVYDSFINDFSRSAF